MSTLVGYYSSVKGPGLLSEMAETGMESMHHESKTEPFWIPEIRKQTNCWNDMSKWQKDQWEVILKHKAENTKVSNYNTK